MVTDSDYVFRTGGWTSIQRVVQALRSISGVRTAEARSREALDGSQEIIAFLTLASGAELTPLAILEKIRRRFPQTCWPDRVLVAQEFGQGNEMRQAA